MQYFPGKWKHLFGGVLLSFSLSAMPSGHQAPEFLKGTLFDTIAAEYELDPLLLYAISLTESALATGDKTHEVKPYVYAIRTPSGAFFPETLNEARFLLDISEMKHGRKAIDLGIMQINGLHWGRVDSKYALFNPETNIRLGAQILSEAMSSSKDRVLRVGHYHSYTPSRARSYGKKVLQIYANLKNL